MVMQKSEMGLTNPIDMMYHIQPWMIFTLLPFALSFEGNRNVRYGPNCQSLRFILHVRF